MAFDSAYKTGTDFSFSQTMRGLVMPASPSQGFSKAMTEPSARLLNGLPEDIKTSFLAEGHKLEVGKNVTLCHEGKKASNLFLLTKGHAKYYRVTGQGKQIILYWLERGDTFGIATLLADPLPYMGTADSVSSCEVISWTQATVRRYAMAHPQLSSNVIAIVLHYLSLLVDRHSAILSSTAHDRIVKALLRIGDRKGHANPDSVDVEITNEELAALADVSPFTVSRVLHELHLKGALTKRRKALSIQAPEALLPEAH